MEKPMTGEELFKIDDEEGKVAVYRRDPRSALFVGFGDVMVAAQFLGYAEARESKDIPDFKTFLATVGAAEKAA